MRGGEQTRSRRLSLAAVVFTILGSFYSYLALASSPANADAPTFPANYPSGVTFSWINDIEILDSLGNKYAYNGDDNAYEIQMSPQGSGSDWCSGSSNGGGYGNAVASLTFGSGLGNPNTGQQPGNPSSTASQSSALIIYETPTSATNLNCHATSKIVNVADSTGFNYKINYYYANGGSDIIQLSNLGIYGTASGADYAETTIGGNTKYVQVNGGTCPGYITTVPGGSGQLGTVFSGSFCTGNIPSQNIFLEPISSASSGGGGGPTGPPAGCSAGPAVSWIICGIIVDPLLSGIKDMASFMASVLQTPPLSATASGSTSPSAVYTIWKSIRDIADVLFVLAFMIAIFGTMIVPNVDAYTIKKVLPRLIAAAIVVQFSFFIGQFAIDIGNILGNGVQGIFSSVTGSGFSFNAGGAGSQAIVVATGLIAAGVATLAIASISAVALLSAAIAIIAVIFTLILRQVLLLLLVVVSPIAFVAWILPSTEKLFKLWYKNLIRLVLMYPMVMGLIGAGQLFAKVAQSSGTGPTSGIIQLVGLIIPLFLIPATFKASGSLMGFAAGMVTGFAGRRSKQLQGSQFAKSREENRQRNAALTAGALDKEGIGGFRKAIARRRGGFTNSITGQRRLAATAADLRKKDVDAATAVIEQRGIGTAGEGNIKSLEAIVKNPGTSSPELIAALQMLTRTMKGREKLTELQSTGEAGKHELEWNSAMKSSADTIADAAPHLFNTSMTPEKMRDTYKGMEGERVAKLDSVGMRGYLTTVDPVEAEKTFGQMSPRMFGDVKGRFNETNLPDLYPTLKGHLDVVAARKSTPPEP